MNYNYLVIIQAQTYTHAAAHVLLYAFYWGNLKSIMHVPNIYEVRFIRVM